VVPLPHGVIGVPISIRIGNEERLGFFASPAVVCQVTKTTELEIQTANFSKKGITKKPSKFTSVYWNITEGLRGGGYPHLFTILPGV
jgi:hypothetical protein